MDHEVGITPSRRHAITVRAIVLGLVAVVVQTFIVSYEGHVARAGSLNLAQFPVGTLITFMLLVMLNLVLRVTVPRKALSAVEMLTVLAMCWVAGGLGGRAWTGRIIGMLGAPGYLASPENRWIDILGGLDHDTILPTWLFPDVGSGGVDLFYSGVPSGTPAPWAAWAVPLFWWSAAAVAFLSYAVSITSIFYRQWAEHERLSFPLISVPTALVEERAGHRLPPMFKRRLFWIGVLVSGGVLCWNIGTYFSPSWPEISIYASAVDTQREMIAGFPQIPFRIQPLVIGFLYLANLDLLMSLWLFYLLGWIEAGISDTTGFAMGSGAVKVGGWDLVRVHSFGALVFLGLWSVWVARRHLRHVVRRALSRDRAADNPGGMMRYRTALLVLIWAVVFLVAFCREIGMSWGVIALALGFNFIAFFVVAKYMAATGLMYINPSYTAGGRLIINMAGNAWMTPKSVIGLGLIHGGYFGQMQRLWGFGMMPHAFKVTERAHSGQRRMVWALILAFVFGSAFGLWHVLHLGFTRGGLRMEEYTFQRAPLGDFGYIMDAVEDVQDHRGMPADGEKIGAFGIGFGVCAMLALLHTRLTWWPLHPVGLAFSMTSAGNYWLSILIVWLVKLIILKTGGVSLYEKWKPFFIGLIVGYVLALIISFGVDAIFFAGQPGHQVHNW